MAAQKFYAVKEGKTPGIYRSWAQCKAQVHGHPGALYKSFVSEEEARAYLAGTRPSLKERETPAGCHIFVDGSYLKARYGWGFAVYENGKLICTKNGLGDDSEAAKLHNVAGEIAGAIQAVLWAEQQGIAQIVIHHDYIGISEWAEKRWKTNNEITRGYAAFMEPYLPRVRFAKVAGHTGVEGNELADRLAKQALGIL